jgi:hypothetical protein
MVFGAMFLYPDGINPNLILLAVCITGLIVGFAWIRWAAGPDPDKEPSFWRYRQADKVRWLSNVKWPMPGWIATRLAMAVAAGVLVFVFAPRLLRVFVYAVGNAPWLWFVAIGLASAGTLWILRIARADPEADAIVDLDEFMAESNARAHRGRRLARAMFAAALMALAIPAFFFIAAPNGPTAMYLQEPPALHAAIPFVGVAGIVIGLVWMVRIFRADPEPENAKGWRYRD